MSDVIAYETGHGLYLNITNRCPCDCIFCVRKDKTGVNIGENLWLSREPTYDEIIGALRARDIASYDEIVFCGFGEPTERLDTLLEVAFYIKENHPTQRTRLNTNGLSDLINGKPTAELLSKNVDMASISLNASNKTEYQRICRPVFGESSFDAMLFFALESKRCFKDTCFTIVDSIGKAEIDDCKNLCEKLGIRLRVRAAISE
ncbi:MAG: TatD family nuclease-associated radical SAM protein [Oscillospiraceae bacterium]|nr:TatD family nuclease-associated radical SAM protein [Oscillospiraceae bacterium]